VPFLRGHIFAVPNPPLKEWQDMLTPLDPAALAEYINVFCCIQRAMLQKLAAWLPKSGACKSGRGSWQRGCLI
jgi:diadenosine tetraphosphate (Ap4A) HIT family hydrolase